MKVWILGLLTAAALAGGDGARYPLEEGKYLGIVRQYADVLLQHGRDVYGPVHSPMFVDTLSPRTLKPYVWTIDPDEPVVRDFGQPARQIMANFLFMQSILDTLRELGRLTADPRYAEAANQCAAFALEHAVAPSGLIHWGKHATYDTLSDQPLGHPGAPGFHYFTGGGFASWRFLYTVNARAVNRHIEQQWNVTIDSPEKWRRLEWDLHPQYTRPYGYPWRHADKIEADVEVPFTTHRRMYPQIALELLYAARMYAEQPGNDERSWEIGRILLKRFEDAREPRTGVTLPMFAHAPEPAAKKWFGASVRTAIGIPFFAKMAEISLDGGDGARFLDFSRSELRAYHRHKKGSVEDSVLWAFALMYRLTGDGEMWSAVRDIARGRGYGDIGNPDGAGVALRFDDAFDTGIQPERKRNTTAGFIVHTFVELYRKTRQDRGDEAARPYLEYAAKAADAIIAETYVNGLFVRRKDAMWARTASAIPMALLDLEAAIRGVELAPESVFCRRGVYRFTRAGDRQPGDNGHDWAIYTATSSEPPQR